MVGFRPKVKLELKKIGEDKGKIEAAKGAVRQNEASKLELLLSDPSHSLLQTSNNIPSVSIKATVRLRIVFLRLQSSYLV